jgi:DNA polymerase
MVKDGYLFCALPSGRLLAYFDPKVEPNETSWGEVKDTVTYMSVNSVSKKWERTKTYGGKIVENLCQAVARDLMAEAMLRVESAGYKVVLTVHDEILTEATGGDVKKFETLMAELPAWAAGCPVKAEGWQGKRYQK